MTEKMCSYSIFTYYIIRCIQLEIILVIIYQFVLICFYSLGSNYKQVDDATGLHIKSIMVVYENTMCSVTDFILLF